MQRPSDLRSSTAAVFVLAMAAGVTACSAEDRAPNVPEFRPAFPEQTRAPAMTSDFGIAVETFGGPLENPWAIDRLPGGGYLVTEKPGRLRIVSDDGRLSDPVEGLPAVLDAGQGGLLDVAVGPTFASDRLVYWTYAKPVADDLSATAAARGRLSEDGRRLTGVVDLFVQQPASPTPMHYGSRLAFDGAGHLFVTTGEHFTEDQRRLAQDPSATYGKVVRLRLDGAVPADNPFVAAGGPAASVWTLGHRNVQGAAVEPATGRLWTIEHGPQGGDELNLASPGANFGWPVVSYGENYDETPVGEGRSTHGPEFVEPRYTWDPVIAPSGMTFYRGDLFPGWAGDLLVASLRPGGLVRLDLDGDTVVGEERLLAGQGRIRDVVEAPDGAVLVITDASDGAILRLTPGDTTN
jgi:glucose/arabinose dehydrogenase